MEATPGEGGLAAESNLLVVTSTYGDGDMPDNAQGFWDWLQTDEAQSPGASDFSVLALGGHAITSILRRRQKIRCAAGGTRRQAGLSARRLRRRL